MKNYECDECWKDSGYPEFEGHCLLSVEDFQIVCFCPVDKKIKACWQEVKIERHD